ncbi:MAG: ThuA domain-containing protein [Bacteroidota bacterium]
MNPEPTLEGKNILFTYGGWDGHDPEGCVKLFKPWMESEGAKVHLYDNLEIYQDSVLMDSMDLIVQTWTMGKIDEASMKGLLKAVKNGCGFAGWHGGIGDAFRNQPAYQFMVGGQWVAHPGGFIPEHDINIVDHEDPVTHGIKDFTMTSTEQYYMHVDPNVKVLATTTFSSDYADWIEGCTMPVVWKKMYGEGRIFYISIGHYVKDLERPDVFSILNRGFRWASESRYAEPESWIQPKYAASSGWEELLKGDLSNWGVSDELGLEILEADTFSRAKMVSFEGKEGENLLGSNEMTNYHLQFSFRVDDLAETNPLLKYHYGVDASSGKSKEVYNELSFGKMEGVADSEAWHLIDVYTHNRMTYILLDGKLLEKHLKQSAWQGRVHFMGNQSTWDLKNLRIRSIDSIPLAVLLKK